MHAWHVPPRNHILLHARCKRMHMNDQRSARPTGSALRVAHILVARAPVEALASRAAVAGLLAAATALQRGASPPLAACRFRFHRRRRPTLCRQPRLGACTLRHRCRACLGSGSSGARCRACARQRECTVWLLAA